MLRGCQATAVLQQPSLGYGTQPLCQVGVCNGGMGVSGFRFGAGQGQWERQSFGRWRGCWRQAPYLFPDTDMHRVLVARHTRNRINHSPDFLHSVKRNCAPARMWQAGWWPFWPLAPGALEWRMKRKSAEAASFFGKTVYEHKASLAFRTALRLGDCNLRFEGALPNCIWRRFAVLKRMRLREPCVWETMRLRQALLFGRL